MLEELVAVRFATRAVGRPIVLAGLVMPRCVSLVSSSVAVMRVCLVAVFGSLL